MYMTDPVFGQQNVVFLVLDSLRTDRVGAYNNAVDFTDHLDTMAERLMGYDLTVLVTTRALYPVARSQMRHRDHLKTLEQAYARIRAGYAHTFEQVAGYDFIVVPYESLPQTHRKLCEILDLNEPSVDIYDGNAKYFP